MPAAIELLWRDAETVIEGECDLHANEGTYAFSGQVLLKCFGVFIRSALSQALTSCWRGTERFSFVVLAMFGAGESRAELLPTHTCCPWHQHPLISAALFPPLAVPTPPFVGLGCEPAQGADPGIKRM